MADPMIWKFVQIGGTATPLTLAGWNAPFGRERRGAVVEMGVHTPTRSTTFDDGTRTVHAFGYEGKPFELKGRWMDAAMVVPGGAQKFAREWKSFVEARKLVRATWGDILSYQIFIEDLE